MGLPPQTDRTEPHPVAPSAQRGAQPVVLVDRIPWQWYLATAAIPVVGALIGFVAGIVFMARSKIGPALALWATAALAAVVWGAIGWLVLLGWAFDRASQVRADTPRVVEPAERSLPESVRTPEEEEEEEPAPADEPDPVEPVPAGDDMRSCGNLTVAAASTTCEFAQNVFWEYWTASGGATSHATEVSAYSPALERRLDLTCEDGDPVVCRGDEGAEVRMPVEALAAYTQQDADAYAADHTVGGG